MIRLESVIYTLQCTGRSRRTCRCKREQLYRPCPHWLRLRLKAPSVGSCPFSASHIIIPRHNLRPQSKSSMHDMRRRRSTIRDGSTWNTWGQSLQPCSLSGSGSKKQPPRGESGPAHGSAEAAGSWKMGERDVTDAFWMAAVLRCWISREKKKSVHFVLGFNQVGCVHNWVFTASTVRAFKPNC